MQQPTLVITFEVPQFEDAQTAAQPRSSEFAEEPEMGAGCAIMSLATLAFFVGALTCCVRAALAALPRRAAPLPQRQILVDCTAGELSSPLLVVDEDVMVVTHRKS